jgi:hypothetical protein
MKNKYGVDVQNEIVNVNVKITFYNKYLKIVLNRNIKGLKQSCKCQCEDHICKIGFILFLFHIIYLFSKVLLKFNLESKISTIFENTVMKLE